MRPVVDRLKQAYAGKVDVKVMMLDGNDTEAERLAGIVGVQYVPTFVFVDSNGAQQGLVVGEMSEADMRARLDALR
ncbi:MAG: thioredoxin domain-containing protein [Coriobacteriia bacterium]|nr:thioredoxin domain-containing protein [Coriobacteriia bacterium]